MENIKDLINENNLDNKLSNEIIKDNVNLEKEQNKFLETSVGKVVNTGIDIALRTILPNIIEDEVIAIKNTMITEGFQNGIKAAINSAISLGKSAMRNCYREI